MKRHCRITIAACQITEHTKTPAGINAINGHNSCKMMAKDQCNYQEQTRHPQRLCLYHLPRALTPCNAAGTTPTSIFALNQNEDSDL
mmetsp:Transcript_47750/g.70017  ORF Transcript_47750/g.70017 Transcript_47750/m.70017 type:complete len:87 (-) Transcript_47750:14-274(-)